MVYSFNMLTKLSIHSIKIHLFIGIHYTQRLFISIATFTQNSNNISAIATAISSAVLRDILVSIAEGHVVPSSVGHIDGLGRTLKALQKQYEFDFGGSSGPFKCHSVLVSSIQHSVSPPPIIVSVSTNSSVVHQDFFLPLDGCICEYWCAQECAHC